MSADSQRVPQMRQRPPSAAGMSRSAEAAAVSLPGMLRRAQAVDRARWVWRTPLERTQAFWDGWCCWPRNQRVCCPASLPHCLSSVMLLILGPFSC